MAVTVEVWPDNWLPWSVFRWLDTQWCIGVNGATGLRYEVFPEARLRFGIAPDKWPDLCDDLQALEAAALEQMRK